MSFKEKVIFNICILNNNVTFCHCCSGVKSCPTLCNLMDYSLLGSSVHGIFQARILEWLPFPPPGDVPHPEIEPVVQSLG